MTNAKRKTAPKRTASRPRARRTATKLKVHTVKVAVASFEQPEDVEAKPVRERTPFEKAAMSLHLHLDRLAIFSGELEQRLASGLTPTDVVMGSAVHMPDGEAPVITAVREAEAKVLTVVSRVQYLLDNLAI